MTDEQIVKALERCKTYDDLRACYKCPALENGDCSNGKTYISDYIAEKVLDLINRQKAEIGRLQHYKQSYDELKAEHLETIKAIKQLKSEAIKEFIKEHREIMMAFCDDDDQISLKVCEYDANTDNLVKEMVGDSDA